MKVSIALAAYNGQCHFADQLDSICTQIRPPHELVLVDDASTDETRAIAEGFARTAPFPVRIRTHDSNRGSTVSFAEAIAPCTGDIIVLSDQDDLWHPRKLEVLANALKDRPDAAFAFSDAEIVDANLSPMGYKLWDAIRFGKAERWGFRSGGAFECLLRRHRVTGATMAFRAELRDRILPIPEGWVHDAWIALILTATLPCVLIEDPLILYRQHDHQQHGGRKRGFLAQYNAAKYMTATACRTVAERYQEALNRLETFDDVPFERLNRLREKIEHHRRRAALRESGTWRLPRVLHDAVRGRYSRFDQGWKTIAQDLMLG